MQKWLTFLMVLCCWTVFSQSRDLAENYFDQGEYEKAASVYEQLYAKNHRDIRSLEGLVASWQELKKYKEVEELLLKTEEWLNVYPQLWVELGRNYQLQEQPEKAKSAYKNAIERVKDRPNYAYSVGNAFQNYSLLDEAVEVYKIALDERSSASLTVQLARIYGELGQLEQMFETYIDLVDGKPEYFYAINRNFSLYIQEDPSTEANQILRKLLLKRMQQEPKLLYNELLSWLFVQQADYQKAFIQEKAIYQRSEEKNIRKIRGLAMTAHESGFSDAAKNILAFVIEHGDTREVLKAYELLMEIKIEQYKTDPSVAVEEDFRQLFERFGKENNTLKLQLLNAEFLAFQKGEQEQAKTALTKLLDKRLNRFEESQVKLLLGDILVVQEYFNQALIYYSQVQKLVENTDLAQEARYKVAQTSYYKGDFDWAQTQLKVLKESTSQLIANDALQLHLLIRDNSLEDSTQTALKQFAKADLYRFQNQPEKSMRILDSLLNHHKGEKIEDEALFRKAKLLEAKGDYADAAAAYQSIISLYGDDILADDAYFFLGKLYENQLAKPEEAQQQYEQLIFNFADSIYVVEARKRYRNLRGDVIE